MQLEKSMQRATMRYSCTFCRSTFDFAPGTGVPSSLNQPMLLLGFFWCLAKSDATFAALRRCVRGLEIGDGIKVFTAHRALRSFHGLRRQSDWQFLGQESSYWLPMVVAPTGNWVEESRLYRS